MKVNLYIYDISKGMARQLSLPLIGKNTIYLLELQLY